MILEEIIGDVVASIVRENGQAATLAIGDYFSEHERSSLSVTGKGKVVVRVDANCTVEVRGVEAPVAEAPVETPAPVAKPAKAAKAAPAEPAPVETPAAE